jgi:hypothetical protein
LKRPGYAVVFTPPSYFVDHYQIIISNINGHKIGIERERNPYSRLGDSLNDFETEGCDIIFYASKTSGMTVDRIN